MTLDLSKLSDAVNKVAGLANQAAKHKEAADTAQATAATHKAAHDAIVAELQAAQTSVDALTASLLAATTSPAEAVGVAAVAAALAAAPVAAPVAPVAPVALPPLPDPVAHAAPAHGILDAIRGVLHTAVVEVSPSPAPAPAPTVAPAAQVGPGQQTAAHKLPPSMAEIAAAISAAHANKPK
jgi:hypothetical protein